MAVQSGGLLLTTSAGWRIPLDAIASDRFVAGPWSLDFVREPAGRVTALELHRVRKAGDGTYPHVAWTQFGAQLRDSSHNLHRVTPERLISR